MHVEVLTLTHEMKSPRDPRHLNSRLLGYATVGYIEPRTHYLGNWRSRAVSYRNPPRRQQVSFRGWELEIEDFAGMVAGATPSVCVFVGSSGFDRVPESLVVLWLGGVRVLQRSGRACCCKCNPEPPCTPVAKL